MIKIFHRQLLLADTAVDPNTGLATSHSKGDATEEKKHKKKHKKRSSKHSHVEGSKQSDGEKATDDP